MSSTVGEMKCNLQTFLSSGQVRERDSGVRWREDWCQVQSVEGVTVPRVTKPEVGTSGGGRKGRGVDKEGARRRGGVQERPAGEGDPGLDEVCRRRVEGRCQRPMCVRCQAEGDPAEGEGTRGWVFGRRETVRVCCLPSCPGRRGPGSGPRGVADPEERSGLELRPMMTGRWTGRWTGRPSTRKDGGVRQEVCAVALPSL